MLKKIPVHQVRVGMYLHALCGTSWLDHPFWKTSFVLKSPADLDKLLQSPVKEVVIDVDKGLDVAPEPAALRLPEVGSADDERLRAELRTPLPDRPASPSAPRRVSLEAEVLHAQRVLTQAKTQIKHLFRQARLGRVVDTTPLKALAHEVSDSLERNPHALISLARLKTKDDYTYLHSVAVAALCAAVARQLQLSAEDVREAALAGLLHDLGKAVIPLEILNKPGRLTQEEFICVQAHPRAGFEMLQRAGVRSEMALDVCLHHHEKIDGSGYPDRLSGDAISLHAKIGAVCDVYDAITSDRPYKAGWHPAESVRKMALWAKEGHFDERVFQAFVKCVGIYPTGSLVRLQSGRLGVVLEQNEHSLLRPRVKVFFSTKSNTYIVPEVLDLGAAYTHDRIVGPENPADWGISNLDALWTGLPGLAP
ncbi:HD-GYP domain-containing protein [Caldimonas manganoxidans]|uniref:HD-GYP domain-containing protein n=1 Tax=Caldimonas manganoxidans TaxID=196015 RepID=UPI0003A396FF|nr:HD-GYP domain-containing protein [Caldimonas manganoxidans]